MIVLVVFLEFGKRGRGDWQEFGDSSVVTVCTLRTSQLSTLKGCHKHLVQFRGLIRI